MVTSARSGTAWEFVKSMSLGGAYGFISDGLVEVSKFPYLNDVAPIGGANMSNLELVNYGTGLLMSALGFLDMVAGARPLGGFGKHLLPIGLGSILGTNLYEQFGAKALGIR